MQLPFTTRHYGWAAVVATLLGSAVLLSSAPSGVSKHQKAYYAGQRAIDFVRPGLTVRISSVSVSADGTIQARFSVTDPKGSPLDVDGVAPLVRST